MATTTSNIIVLNADDIEYVSNDTELMLYYDKLKHILPDIPRHVFDDICDIIATSDYDTPIQSNVPSILIKKIENNITLVINKDWNVSKYADNKYYISTQFDIPMKMRHISDGPMQSARRTQINIMGYEYNSHRGVAFNGFNHPYRIKYGVDSLVNMGYTSPLNDMFSKYDTSYVFQNTVFGVKDHVRMVKFTDVESDVESIKQTIDVVNACAEYYKRNNITLLNLLYASASPYNIYKHNVGIGLPVSSKYIGLYVFPIIKDMYPHLNNTWKMFFIHDVISRGLWKLYTMIRLFGATHPNTTHVLDDIKARSESADYVQAAMNASLKNTYKTAHLQQVSYSMYNKKYDDLHDDERSIVNTKYNTDVMYDESVKNNKCIHIKLVNSVLSKAKFVGGTRFPTNDWTMLKEIVPNKYNNSMNECTRCNLDALCPHYYDIFDMDKDASMYKIMLNWVDGISAEKQSYYCKICGNMLIKNIEQISSDISYTAYDGDQLLDPLNKKIYNDVSSIFRTNINVSKNTDVDYIKRSIQTSILSYINDEESRLLKIKTNSQTTIDMTIYITISAYVYASIVKLILYNKSILSFRRSDGGAVYTGGLDQVVPSDQIDVKLLQRLLKTALSLIIKSKKTTMKNIPGMSDNDVKNILSTAFRNVSKFKIRGITITTHMYNVASVRDSPYYKYLNHGYIYDNVYDALGHTNDELSKMSNPFVDVKLRMVDKHKHINNYFGYNVDEYVSYISESYVDTMSQVINGGFADISDDYTSKLRNTVKKYHELETKLTQNNRLDSYTGYKSFDASYYKHTYIKPHPYTSYDIKGHNHIFDIFIYSHGDKRYEILNKDIKDWVYDESKNKIYMMLKMVDKKCSVCGDVESDILKTIYGKKSNIIADEITAIIRGNIDRMSFYNYYTNRCPVKYTHIWVNNKCEYCGIALSDIANNNSVIYDKYVTKYKSDIAYDNIRNMKYINAVNDANTMSEMLIDTKYDTTNVSDITGITNAILTLSKISGVKYNMVLKLGLSLHYLYSDIKSDIVNPLQSQDIDTFIVGISRVRLYINIVVVEYYRLKNGGIIKLDGVPKDTYNAFQNIVDMPNIDLSLLRNEIYEKSYNVSFDIEELKTIHGKHITILSALLVGLVEGVGGGDRYRKAVVQYVQYIMGIIIDTDTLLSLPDKSKKNVVGALITKRAVDGADDEYVITDAKDIDVNDFDPFDMSEVGYEESDVYNDM